MAQLDATAMQRLSECIDHQPRTDTPQQRFDHTYITAQDIMDIMDVTRPTVLAKLKMRFPTIKVGNTYFWERSPELSTFLNAWEVMRTQGE